MKKLFIFLAGLVIVLSGCSLSAPAVEQNSVQLPENNQQVQTSSPATVPVNEKTSTSSTASSIYENQYLKISVQAGWKLSEATKKIQDQTYDQTTGKVTPVGAPVVSKTGAINIMKGNYILYINPQAQQASGVTGGRFAEISMGAPSADAVITVQPSDPCGTSKTFPAGLAGYTRVDFYTNNQGKQSWCAAPADGSTIWYFSYVTDSRKGYFNYYKDGEPLGLVITLAYNSKDVNQLPVEGSAELDARLGEMTGMIKTLVIKTDQATAPVKNKLTAAELAQRKSECQKIKTNPDQDNCYAQLAIDSNDTSLCPQFGSLVCKYFAFLNNTDLCSNIDVGKISFNLESKDEFAVLSKKQECVKKIAISTKNTALCDNLFDQSGSCRDTIALAQNDVSECSDPGTCTMVIALRNNDIATCEKVNGKAWCLAEFPRLAQAHQAGKDYNTSCYLEPVGVDVNAQPANLKLPNNLDAEANDYPAAIAPQSDFYHLLSVPFNDGNILRVYSSRAEYDSNGLGFVRLVKYDTKKQQSVLIGDVKSQTGSNWGGIYLPTAISQDDTQLIFNGFMGSPGAGGGSIALGYASLSLNSVGVDECGYLNLKNIADNALFYDGYSKALSLTEENNVPPSFKPGPSYNSAIKFTDIITGVTKTLLEESKTIYEIIGIDEKSGVVNFKSCAWQEFQFNCPATDKSTQIRSLNLP